MLKRFQVPGMVGLSDWNLNKNNKMSTTLKVIGPVDIA